MWDVSIDDIIYVLQRKGYYIEMKVEKVGRRKPVVRHYAYLPDVIYGFRQYGPENTAEAVFSRIIGGKSISKEDILNSL